MAQEHPSNTQQELLSDQKGLSESRSPRADSKDMSMAVVPSSTTNANVTAPHMVDLTTTTTTEAFDTSWESMVDFELLDSLSTTAAKPAASSAAISAARR